MNRVGSIKGGLPEARAEGVAIAPVPIPAIAALVVGFAVLQLATVARKLSLEPALTWRFEYAPNRVDRAVYRALVRLPVVTQHAGAGPIHHVGLLHATCVGLLVGAIGVVGAGIHGLADLVTIGLLSVELTVLPSLEVHEYRPIRAVGFGPITTKIHAFSALYAVVVMLALGAASAAGVAFTVVVGIGLLFSVPFVITQAVIVHLMSDEMTDDLDEGPGPTFLPT